MILVLTSLITFATVFFIAFLVDQHVRFVVLILQTIATIYDLITFPIYLIVDKPWKVKRHSRTYYADRHYEPAGDYTYWEIKPEVTNARQASHIEKVIDNVKHLSELLPIAQNFYANLDCVGTRKVLRKVIEKGKTKFELSDYEWQTYRQTQQAIDNLTKVFHHKFQFKRGDRVAIMADTS